MKYVEHLQAENSSLTQTVSWAFFHTLPIGAHKNISHNGVEIKCHFITKILKYVATFCEKEKSHMFNFLLLIMYFHIKQE
jgi:hypothetical protein